MTDALPAWHDRRAMRSLWPALLVPFALACKPAGKPDASPPPTKAEAPAAAKTAAPAKAEAKAPAGEMAPPPFTAEQIRAATPDGRRYVFDLMLMEFGKLRREIVFRDPTETTVRIESKSLSAPGKPAKAETSTTSWAELVSHAAYPAAATTIEDTEVTVPAGTFAAKLYTIREDGKDGLPKVTQAWFAKALPGAPVKHVIQLGNRTDRVMLLLEHSVPDKK